MFGSVCIQTCCFAEHFRQCTVTVYYQRRHKGHELLEIGACMAHHCIDQVANFYQKDIQQELATDIFTLKMNGSGSSRD